MKTSIKYNIFISFFLAILLTSCKDKVINPETEINNIPQLFLNTYRSINEMYFNEICNRLNDSIIKRNDTNFFLAVATNINEITKKVGMDIIEINDDLRDNIPEFDRLVLFIDITDKAEIMVNKKKRNIIDLEKILHYHLFELDSSYKRMVQKKYISKLFGNIETFNTVVVISIDAQNRKSSIEEWKAFYQCFSIIVKVFDEKINNLSLDFTGKPYNSLTFEEKYEFSNFVGYTIKINFDSNKFKDFSQEYY